MSQTINASKIDFKKKTPTARVRKKSVSVANRVRSQMRIVIDHAGYIMHANDAFGAALGVPPMDLNGRALLDSVFFKNLDDITNDRALFNSLSQGGASLLSSLKPGEHVVLIGQNHVPHNFHFDWIKGQNGDKYLVACTTSDDGVAEPEKPDWQTLLGHLTASNQDRETIAETPSPPQTPTIDVADRDVILGMNNDFMCVLDSDGEFISANEAVNAFQTQSFIDAIHPDDRALARQFLQSFQRHDIEDNVGYHPVQFETQLNITTGSTQWVAWTMHAQGEKLYVMGRDITASKSGSVALDRRERELSKLQNLIHMGHWRWNVGSTQLEWSDQIYQIFGVNRDDFQPTLDNTNTLLHKRDIGRMTQAFQRAIIEQKEYELDFRVVRANKSIRYVQCEGRCELDEDGDVIALYGVMQDVTEQTEHEMELRAAKDSAEQAYASKSRFLANMSHELRTPLNAIIGFSDMMKRQMLGELGNDKYVEYATSINDSGEHLLSLITDILDMSKIEAGKYELDLETIQLGALINSAVRMIESRAQEGVIQLDSKVTDDTPKIIADRRAVMQILLNILSNAVKFTEPGGVITVGIDEFDSHVSVKITDNGVGIPANKLSDVLRPFEQVSSAHTRNHEGSGLGLAITKELAELHGGMISLESAEGQGTTASIRLPKDASKKQK